MNYIIYQAHTLPHLTHEVIYSIYSLGLHDDLNKYHFLIYTDNPDSFSPYLNHIKCSFLPLNKERVKEWMGKLQFIHRVKIKMLQNVLENNKGNFLYVDSDTYFIKPIDQIFNKISNGRKMMHCYEGTIGTLKMYRPYNNYLTTIAGNKYKLTKTDEVWNAGALGFNNETGTDLSKVLELTDMLQDYHRKHISEQFSFSYFFKPKQKSDNLDNEIFHYWILKEFRDYLKIIFDHPISKEKEKLSKIVAEVQPIPYSLAKEKFRSHSGLMRAFLRWTGKDFKMPQFENRILS